MYGPRWIWATPLIVLVPASALTCRRALWTLFVAGAVLLLPVMRFCIPLPKSSRGGAQAGTTALRLVTCNVHRGSLDAFAFATFVRDVHPDLVVAESWTSQYDTIFAIDDGWQTRREGQMFFASRCPIWEAVDVIDSTLQTGNGGMARFLIRTPGGCDVNIFAIHLATPREGLSAMIGQWSDGGDQVRQNTDLRGRQSYMARDAVDRSVIPFVVAGDFNMPTDSRIYRRDWSELTNAFSSAGFGFGYTHYTRHSQLRIDHVLAGPEWKVRRCWTGPNVGSPHRPVVADLELRDARGNGA